MAAVALPQRNRTSNGSHWAIPFSPPEYAQGGDGQLVNDDLASAAARWRGQSEYVATILTGRSDQAGTKRILIAAGVLTVSCVALTVGALIMGSGAILFSLAAAIGLAAYASFARWVARQEYRSGLLRFAERIRRSLAYEGDEKTH